MKSYAIAPFVLQILAWPVARAGLFIFSSYRVRGTGYLKDIKGSCIIASNHFNELDPVLLRTAMPWISKPLFWVGRQKKWYDDLPENERFRGFQKYIYSDFFFKIFGNCPAPHGQHDYAKTLEKHLKIIKDGYSMVIFPMAGVEKHVGWGAKVHGGVAYLAAASGAPVLPVGVAGSHRIGWKQFFFDHPHFQIAFGACISVSSSVQDFKAEAMKVVAEIRRLAIPAPEPKRAPASAPVPALAEKRK